jgi:hypothetical protein
MAHCFRKEVGWEEGPEGQEGEEGEEGSISCPERREWRREI